MPIWKQLLLNLYYQSSRPARARRARQYAEQGRSPAVVLYWHRIADDRATPWTLSNKMFIRQISWLKRNYQLVSLAEIQRRLREGHNDSPCVAVTFDDGYADNCDHAVPWLIEHDIPCTYFVTLRNVLYSEPFPHDVKLGHRLAPNTIEQLRRMAASGVEIGAHTYTHSDLASIADRRTLRRELIGARDELQAAVGRPVRYFAFPFGQYEHLSREAFEMADAAGYAAVCSAYGGYNFPDDDPFHLQRIPVDDSMARLKNWVTIDPRKLATRRFEYVRNGVRDSGIEVRGTEPSQGVPSIEPQFPIPESFTPNL